MFVVLDIIELVIAYFLIIETKGPTLEDIAILFDGKDAPATPFELSAAKNDPADADGKGDELHKVDRLEAVRSV